MRKKITTAALTLLCAWAAAGCKAADTELTKPDAGKTETTAPGTERTQREDGNMVKAVYPDMASYPNEEEYMDPKTGEFDSDGFSEAYDVWWEQKRSQRDLSEGCADSLRPFFVSSIREFLTMDLPGREGENRVYSPINVYMALSMLAETVDGESRQQILTLLGADSAESLRDQAGRTWNAAYCQDGAVTSLLANSLWLDEGINYKRETLEVLAEHYYASSYWGKMGSAELDDRLQAWLNEQTGNLLKEQVSGLHMTDDTRMALASTIYYRAKWSDEFSESNTKEEIFHGPQGDLTCDFMLQSRTGTYYWGDKFGAVYKSLQESGGMWLILPDEGVTVEEAVMEDQVTDLILQENEWENEKFLTINLAMPKFDAASNFSLIEGLANLGVTDVFDESRSDFTPLTEDVEGLTLSQASHGARVMVDEEGCIAAAYTVMAAAGGAMPPEKQVDFVLDRPFLFVITSDSGLPLFAGIVRKP